MSNEEILEIKNRQLYDRQIALLNTLLEHNAIAKWQYDKGFKVLTEKFTWCNNS